MRKVIDSIHLQHCTVGLIEQMGLISAYILANPWFEVHVYVTDQHWMNRIENESVSVTTQNYNYSIIRPFEPYKDLVLHHTFHMHYFDKIFPIFKQVSIDNWRNLLRLIQDTALNPKFDKYDSRCEIISKESFEELNLGFQIDLLFDDIADHGAAGG